jgi:hypothetical protein
MGTSQDLAAANIPVDCKAPATSKKNARVAELKLRTHGQERNTSRNG